MLTDPVQDLIDAGQCSPTVRVPGNDLGPRAVVSSAPRMDRAQIGKYRIVEKIGQGAMGEVFKAEDPVLHRFVAIKTISGGMAPDSDLRKRFLREAQSAARLSHPHIITVFDFGEDHDRVFMAMELLEGIDLKEAIRARKLPTLEDRLEVMAESATAWPSPTPRASSTATSSPRTSTSRRGKCQDHGLGLAAGRVG